MTHSKQEELAQYYEPKFKPPSNWTREALAMVEAKRIANIAQVACYATEFPRRLGADATSTDLSADKRLCKRLAWLYLGLWERYTTTRHAPLPLEECPPDLIPPQNWKSLYVQAAADDDICQRGATILWEPWWEEQKPRLISRRTVIATYAVKESEFSWGYRIVVGLSDELRWVEDKLLLWRAALERGKVSI